MGKGEWGWGGAIDRHVFKPVTTCTNHNCCFTRPSSERPPDNHTQRAFSVKRGREKSGDLRICLEPWKGTSARRDRDEEDVLVEDAFWRLARSTFPWYIPPIEPVGHIGHLITRGHS